MYEQPYGFPMEDWERLFVQDRLPVDRPVGLMIFDDIGLSFIDRENVEDYSYVHAVRSYKNI